MIVVELFSKEDCHLCEEAKYVLEKVRQEIPFHFVEKKIAPGDESYELYGERVPVVFINEEEVFHFRVNEEALKQKLREAMR